MMNKPRIATELHHLNDLFESIDTDMDDGIVVIGAFPFPEGWTRRTAPVMVNLPEAYPRAVPRLYIPEDMRYDGEKPDAMRSCGPDGWNEYLVPIHGPGRLFGGGPDPLEWDPTKHTTVTVMRVFAEAIEDPNGRASAPP